MAGVFVAIAASIAPLSVVAAWADGPLQDTDSYLETVGPLAAEPALQEAVSARLEEVIFTHLDLDAVTEDLMAGVEARGLRGSAAATLRALTDPLAAGVRNYVGDQIDDFVRSEDFERAWIAANRAAHEELVAALTGEGGTVVEIDAGAVSVDLAPVVAAIKRQLTDAGFSIADRIPEVTATFVIIESDRLARVQTLLGLLDDLVIWLPLAGAVSLAVAVVVARDRRRIVMVAGLAVAGGMLALGVVLNLVRPIYLDALPSSSSEAAAGAVFDQLASFLRESLLRVLVVAVAVAAGGWLAGGRGTAAPVRLVVVGIAVVGYLAQDHPTGQTALTLVVVTAAVLLVLEVLTGSRPVTRPGAHKPSDLS